MFCPLAAFLFVLFDRHHWITVSWLFDLIDLLLLWGALFYDFRNLLIIAMIHFIRQTVFVYEPLFFFLHNWLRSISFSSLEHVFVCVYVCFAHTHTRTLSPLRKLFSPALIGGLTATEGGETLGLISIPVQSDKCAGTLTWCFGERHTQRGRGGPSCVVYGASESHRGSKAQPSSLTSPRTRSGSAVCALRRTAQTENFTLSLEDRTTPSSFLRLSLLDCALRLLVGHFWLLRPVLLSCGRFHPEPRVTHEAGGRSQDGSVQEAVESEEADPCGVHSAVPASLTAHPPYQCEYERESVKKCEVFIITRSIYTQQNAYHNQMGFKIRAR